MDFIQPVLSFLLLCQLFYTLKEKYNENLEIPHRTILKLNIKTVERDNIDTPNTHILDRYHSGQKQTSSLTRPLFIELSSCTTPGK